VVALIKLPRAAFRTTWFKRGSMFVTEIGKGGVTMVIKEQGVDDRSANGRGIEITTGIQPSMSGAKTFV